MDKKGAVLLMDIVIGVFTLIGLVSLAMQGFNIWAIVSLGFAVAHTVLRLRKNERYFPLALAWAISQTLFFSISTGVEHYYYGSLGPWNPISLQIALLLNQVVLIIGLSPMGIGFYVLMYYLNSLRPLDKELRIVPFRNAEGLGEILVEVSALQQFSFSKMVYKATIVSSLNASNVGMMGLIYPRNSRVGVLGTKPSACIAYFPKYFSTGSTEAKELKVSGTARPTSQGRKSE